MAFVYEYMLVLPSIMWPVIEKSIVKYAKTPTIKSIDIIKIMISFFIFIIKRGIPEKYFFL